MAKRQPSNRTSNSDPTPEETAIDRRHSRKDHLSGRRTFISALGAALGLGGSGLLVGRSAGAPAPFASYLRRDGEVRLPPGTYEWDGSGLDLGPTDALIGDGDPGTTVLSLESGTMEGIVGGRLENIVVRGDNHESKAGIDVHPGATIDGFVWPDGGRRDEDRAFYTPDGGDDPVTIRNSAWAWMANNGAYVDKPPMTIENCAAINNNIAGIRIGHRDGTDDATTVVRNSLIAVTREVASDDTNTANARGIRIRHPGTFVIEDCFILYRDVPGTGDLVEIHDEAAGSTVTLRNCAVYNDSPGNLVWDKTDGDVELTIENCSVAGSGNRTVDPEYDGDGFAEGSSPFPLPSGVTGYPVADDIEGVDFDVEPWNDAS